MLSREALNSALPLTEQLDERGLFLRPVAGTPLETLVQATRSDINFNVPVGGGGWSPDLQNIEYICNVQPKDGTLNAHDVAMDQATRIAADAVKAHLNQARTVVAPAVKELVEKTLEALQTFSPSSLLGMEVKVYEYPKPLFNTSVVSAIQRYENAAFDNPTMQVRMPDLAGEEIVKLLSAGSGGMDRDIADWAAAKGEGFFSCLWSCVFQVKPADGPTKDFRGWVDDRAEGLDHALAIFLLSRRLIEKPIDGVQMNLATMENMLAEYRNQAAARLCQALNELGRVDKVGTLVRSMYDKTIEVNASVYRKWIEAGGQNEVLFGTLLGKKPAYTLDAISEQAQSALATWHHHAALTATVEANHKFNRTKDLLEKFFVEQVRTLTDDDASLAGNRDMVIKAFRDELRLVSEDDLRDLYGCALKLVCRSRFCHTQAERILSGVERVKRDNPELDVREAAAIAMIEYVAYWVSTQLKVESLR